MSTVSIHAPRAGRDQVANTSAALCVVFQSTRPVRGATLLSDARHFHTARFNPRAPCGARQPKQKILIFSILFQSTRPVRGATRHTQHDIPTTASFNPRAPCGARLLGFFDADQLPNVSIHAPRAGRDKFC